MKKTTSTITMNNKTYSATQIDYDSYETITGTIVIDKNKSTEKTLKANQKVGVEEN